MGKRAASSRRSTPSIATKTAGFAEHFVLIAVLCDWIAGDPVAGDDALEAQWFRLDELDDTGLALSLDVANVARLAADIAKQKDGQS